MGRPAIAYLNECRKLHREGRMKAKTKWKAPRRAPTKPRKGEKITRSYAMTLAVRYLIRPLQSRPSNNWSRQFVLS
jgi:hypothetical protein